MQIVVTQVTDLKTNQYGVSSKVHAGNESYFVNEDATKYIGKTLDVAVETKTSANGRQYKIARIQSVLGDQAPASNGTSNGGVDWSEYEKIARVAHRLALELEPDDNGSGDPGAIAIRATARAAIVNTALIAFSNGKLTLDDDIPF